MKKISFLLMILISLFSFSQSVKKTKVLPKGVQVWTVDAVRAKCEGASTMQCLLVKKQGQKEFELFYDNIIDFDFQEGFVYTIWVKEELKTPPIPADASLYNYILVKIVSKKQMTSNQIKPEIKKPLSGMNFSSTKTLIINEEKTACEGNPDAKCLLIKQSNSKEFEVFYQGIDGFVFEEGYRQTILVNERYVANPMIKQVEPIYTMIKVLKKELINTLKKEDVIISEQPKTKLDKKWILRKIKDTDSSSFVIDDNAVFLEINSAESRINGKAPCNTYFGGFKSDFISTFQTSAIASTKMYCDNMKFEEIYFSLLQNAERFEIKDNKLSLYKGDRLLLIFE